MFKRILIPVTAEELSQHVLHYRLEFAKAIGASVVMTYALVEHDYSTIADELLESYGTMAREIGVPYEKRLTDGIEMAIGQAIIEQAQITSSDLILIGTHALEGFNRLVSGSVSEQVVHLAKIPVMVIRSQKQHYTPIKHILVAVDGGTASDSAVSLAESIAPELQANLIFVHVIPNIAPPIADVTGISSLVYDPIKQTQMLATESETILNRAKQSDSSGTATIKGVAAQFESIPKRILETADSEQADLIMMGTYGSVGFERLVLGSISQAVTNHANVPVLLTHAKENTVL